MIEWLLKLNLPTATLALWLSAFTGWALHSNSVDSNDVVTAASQWWWRRLGWQMKMVLSFTYSHVRCCLAALVTVLVFSNAYDSLVMLKIAWWDESTSQCWWYNDSITTLLYHLSSDDDIAVTITKAAIMMTTLGPHLCCMWRPAASIKKHSLALLKVAHWKPQGRLKKAGSHSGCNCL